MNVDLSAPIPPLPEVITGVPVEPGDSNEPLVDIVDYSRGAILVLPAYEHPAGIPNCLARAGVVDRLIAAAEALPPDIRLGILDAWRPISMQVALFEDHVGTLVQQDPRLDRESAEAEASRFVTNPYRVVPPHSTGGAIDIVLVDSNGVPLWHGSGFDEFTERSRTRYLEEAVEAGEGLSERDSEALACRRMLFNALAAQGFSNYPNEWWHFDFGDSFWSQATGRRAIYGAIEPELGR